MTDATDLLAAIAQVNLNEVQVLVDQYGDPGLTAGEFDPFTPVDDHAEFTAGLRWEGQLVDPNPDDTTLDAMFPDDMVPVATFTSIGSTFAVGPKGTLRLTLITERSEKAKALPVTDWPGMRLHVVVLRPLLPEELYDDDDD